MLYIGQQTTGQIYCPKVLKTLRVWIFYDCEYLVFRFANTFENNPTVSNDVAVRGGHFCRFSWFQLFLFLLFFLIVPSLGKAFSAAFAFKEVTTFLPVLASNSSLATLATLPPCFAAFLLYGMDCIKRKSCSVSATSVKRILPSSAGIFKP